MKNNLFKRYLSLFLSCLLIFLMFAALPSGAHVSADNIPGRSPRLVSGLKLTSDIDEVDGGNLVTFTASFLDTMAVPEPVIVTTNNGSTFMAESESDIEFTTNGVRKDITNLDVSYDCDKMTFMTAEPTARKISTIKFQVLAPLGADSFDVQIQVGTGIGIGTKTIKVISGLTIESPDDLTDEDEFYITGNARYKGQQPPEPSYIFVEIVNKETGEPMDEIQFKSDIVDHRYSFGPLTLPSGYDDGTYIINVYMMNDDIYLLGTASKEITYKKVRTEITAKITPSEIIKGTNGFYIAGEARYKGQQPPEPSYIFLELINKETDEPVDEIQMASEVINSKYEFGPIEMPDTCEEGTYIVCLYLIHDDLNLLAITEKEIVYKKK